MLSRIGASASRSTSATSLVSTGRLGSRRGTMKRYASVFQPSALKGSSSPRPSASSRTTTRRCVSPASPWRRSASAAIPSAVAPVRSTRRVFNDHTSGSVSLKMAEPRGEATTRSAASRNASSKAAARARSLVIAERGRVSEHAELGDVATEEEGHRPVGDDPKLSGEQRELVQVIGTSHEPAEEAAQPQTEDICNAFVTAQGGHLPQHAVLVGTRAATEVLRQPACLAEGVLAGGRIETTRRRLVRDAGTVAERPDVFEALDLEQGVHHHPPTVVERQAQFR